MSAGNSATPHPWMLSSYEATALSLFLITAALQYGDGQFSHVALAAVTVGLFFCVWGFISKDRRLRWPLLHDFLAGEPPALVSNWRDASKTFLAAVIVTAPLAL